MSIKIPIKLSDLISPVIFLAFFQFAATALSQFIFFPDNFVILQIVSGTIGVYFTYCLRKQVHTTIDISIFHCLVIISAALMLCGLFIIRYQAIYDIIWPSTQLGLVSQVARGHFPVSFLSFPGFPANYHQAFLFLSGTLAFWSDISTLLSMKVTIISLYFYSIVLLQVFVVVYSSSKYWWIPLLLLLSSTSMYIDYELIPLIRNEIPFIKDEIPSISNYYLSTSWPLALNVLVVLNFIFFSKKGALQKIDIFKYLLVLSLSTINATVYTISLLTIFLFILRANWLDFKNQKKIGFNIQNIRMAAWKFFPLAILLLAPKFIPSVFLYGDVYASPEFVFRSLWINAEYLFNSQPLFFLKFIQLSGILSVAAVILAFLTLWKKNIPSDIEVTISLSIFAAFLFPMIFEVKNIGFWDNIHKFSIMLMFLSILLLTLKVPNFSERFRYWYVYPILLCAWPLFGDIKNFWVSDRVRNENGIHFFSEELLKTPTDIEDVVLFLSNQQETPFIYPFGDEEINISGRAIYIASYSGSFLMNSYAYGFLLNADLENEYHRKLQWWSDEYFLETISSFKDNVWILVKNNETLSFREIVKGYPVEIDREVNFITYTLFKVRLAEIKL